MLMHKKSMLLFVVLLMAVMMWNVSAANLVDQLGVLSGRVVGGQLVSVGSFVKEGSILVTVESITGATPAVRANRDGIVRQVLVKPGDMVKAGQVLARIEPSGR